MSLKVHNRRLLSIHSLPEMIRTEKISSKWAGMVSFRIALLPVGAVHTKPLGGLRFFLLLRVFCQDDLHEGRAPQRCKYLAWSQIHSFLFLNPFLQPCAACPADITQIEPATMVMAIKAAYSIVPVCTLLFRSVICINMSSCKAA